MMAVRRILLTTLLAITAVTPRGTAAQEISDTRNAATLAMAHATRIHQPVFRTAHRLAGSIALPGMRYTQAQDTTFQGPSPFRLLRVAKWSVLAGAAGAGVWGFLENEKADDRFHELELLCEAERQRCAQRTPSGEYADPEFEAAYQRVRELDGNSHRALLLSQAGLAASVVFFLLDLGNVRPPPDIPYDPRGLDVQMQRDGAVEVTLGLRLTGK